MMYDASAPQYFPIGRMRPDDSPTTRTRVIPEKMRNDVIFAASFYVIKVTGSEYAMCRGTRILPWSMKKAHSVKVLFFKKAVLPFVKLSVESVSSNRWFFKEKTSMKKKKSRKRESMIPIIQIYVLLYTLIYFK